MQRATSSVTFLPFPCFVHPPKTQSASPSLQSPSPCCPPAPRPWPSPAAIPSARDPSYPAHALPATLPAASSRRLSRDALSSAAVPASPPKPPKKSSAPPREKRRSQYPALPSPPRRLVPRAAALPPRLAARPQSSPVATPPALLPPREYLRSLPAHPETRDSSTLQLPVPRSGPSTQCAFQAPGPPTWLHSPAESSAPTPSRPPLGTSPRCPNTNIPASRPLAAPPYSSPTPPVHQSLSSVPHSFFLNVAAGRLGSIAYFS